MSCQMLSMSQNKFVSWKSKKNKHYNKSNMEVKDRAMAQQNKT